MLKWLKRLFLAALLAAALAALVFLPVNEYLRRFLAWVEGLGPWGLVVLAAAYTPACLLCIPGSLLTLGGGLLFGVLRGTVAISLGSTVGASAAFLAGRWLLRGLLEEKFANSPRFQALDRAVAERGFKIVLLTRLSPVIPFNLLNYAYGLTRVRFGDYVLASWIGMLPGTVMYVYLGSTARELAELVSGKPQGGWAAKAWFLAGLLVTVLVTVYVTRVARQALREAMGDLNQGRQPAAGGANHG
jgi:uncharacterized membrane protein YdjX (TVP38/TMEM64 family)